MRWNRRSKQWNKTQNQNLERIRQAHRFLCKMHDFWRNDLGFFANLKLKIFKHFRIISRIWKIAENCRKSVKKQQVQKWHAFQEKVKKLKKIKILKIFWFLMNFQNLELTKKVKKQRAWNGTLFEKK